MTSSKTASYMAVAATLLMTGCAPREKARVVTSSTAPSVYHEESFDDVVAQGADGSVEQAKTEYGITLDYQPASVKQVDTILTKLHAQYLQDKANPRWKMEGLGWGAYVGEVIRKKYGGHWQKVDAVTGNPLPLVWRNGTSFPVTWSIEHIINGSGSSIWSQYQRMTSPAFTHANDIKHA